MKRLEEHLKEACEGTVEIITASELRSRPGEIITLASMGVAFGIKRHGKVVAFLTRDADIGHTINPDGSCETLDLERGASNVIGVDRFKGAIYKHGRGKNG